MANPEVISNKIPELDDNTKTELESLAGAIDVKEKNFSPIDDLFEKLNSLKEDKKNLALKYALTEASIEIDSEKPKKLGEIADLFDKAVEQKDTSWRIQLKDTHGLTDDEKALVEPFLNEKQSALAYLIQMSSNFAKVQAQRGYGQEAGNLIDIDADKKFGNQTRRALSGLKDWIESDLSNQINFENLTEEKKKEATEKIGKLTENDILEMSFISKSFLEQLKNNNVNVFDKLRKEENGNFTPQENYKFKKEYTNNYAVRKKGNEENKTKGTTNAGDKTKERKIDVMTEKKGDSYVVKNGSESISFNYQKEEKAFTFGAGGSSFSIDAGENFDEGLNKAKKIAKEINRIMTKVKNNHLDVDHFELKGNTLQVDYAMRIFDFGSWNPVKIGTNNYSGVWDTNLINDVESELGIDPATFCDFMNDHFVEKKGKKAEVEIRQIAENRYEVSSHGEKIQFIQRGDGFVFKTKTGTEMRTNGNIEIASHIAAVINYIVSIIKHNGEELDYFEADGQNLQADYKGRYFDVDLLENTQEKIGIKPSTLTTFMNAYRKEVGI